MSRIKFRRVRLERWPGRLAASLWVIVSGMVNTPLVPFDPVMVIVPLLVL